MMTMEQLLGNLLKSNTFAQNSRLLVKGRDFMAENNFNFVSSYSWGDYDFMHKIIDDYTSDKFGKDGFDPMRVIHGWEEAVKEVIRKLHVMNKFGRIEIEEHVTNSGLIITDAQFYAPGKYGRYIGYVTLSRNC